MCRHLVQVHDAQVERGVHVLEIKMNLIHPVDQDGAHHGSDVFGFEHVLAVDQGVEVEFTFAPDCIGFSCF